MPDFSKKRSTEPLSIFKTPEGEALYLAAYAASMTHWPVEYETLELSTSFAKTHLIVSGPKEALPLVLLHGYGFTSAAWFGNAGDLSRYYRTYAIDIPGQAGKSVLTRPMKNRADFTNWLTEVFDALSLKQTGLAGHSHGGWLALSLALSAPERVSKLVLLAPAASFKPLKVGFFLRGAVCGLFPNRFMIKRLVEWMGAKESKANFSKVSHLIEQLYLSFKYLKPSIPVFPTTYTNDELKQIKMPVLLLLGEQEVIYNVPAVICRAARLIPDLKAALVPAAGHGLNLEQPELVNAAILNFLNPSIEPAAQVVAVKVTLA